MKNKTSKSVIIVFAIVLAIVLAFFGTLYYITSTENNYSYAEKKWITDEQSKSLDVYVDNELPVFSYGGEGIYYDYLNELKKDTGLSFNIITTETSNIKLVNKNVADENDIVVYRDHFIILGSTGTSINKLSDLNYKKIGVLSSDQEALTYYLTEHDAVTIKNYDNYDELKSSYDGKQIDYLVLPMYKYINEIISDNLDILFHLDGLYSYYCISYDGEDVNLRSVFTKFYARYKSTAESKMNDYFLNIYFDAKKYTELQRESITDDDFIVGYIDNLPYEGLIRNKFTGLTSTYLEKFSNMTGATYNYINYKDTKDLSNALMNNKVDIVLNYYSLSSENYASSRDLGATEYVVLAHEDNNIVVSSLYALKDSKVNMLSNMNLKYNMASKDLFEINDYANLKSLFKNIDEDSIIIIEKEVYDYYKNSSLKEYSVRLTETIKLNNSFLLNNDNEAFNNLFDFYLSTQSSNEVKNESVGGVISILKSNRVFNFVVNNLVYIIIGFIVILFAIFEIIRKVNSDKKTKNEARLYYFDSMTNLKNRNYLNDNIDFWSSNKVYPQAIIIVDINGLKELNDKEGHEAGDSQIKAVASILIKTQRDNSEIMRTNGDEFMIYLVGYDEKKVGTYIHKLNRELTSTLPNKDHGVSIGYSMINSEQTTIDDAINDSLAMINKSKGK